jgi:hypothetical protein
MLEESDEFHAQEAGGDHFKIGRDKKYYVYTTLCKTKQINSFSLKFGHLLPQKSPIHQF